MTQQNITRTHVLDTLAADRWQAQQAARPAFTTLRPSEQAAELIARMDVARMHNDKAAFLAAQAELKQLVEAL